MPFLGWLIGSGPCWPGLILLAYGQVRLQVRLIYSCCRGERNRHRTGSVVLPS